MPHPAEHNPPTRPLAALEAEDLSETLKALASPGRLRLLTELLGGERTVERLAAVAELSVSATSHHLRLLRSLRLVRARRSGRNVFYSLHDHHIADLHRHWFAYWGFGLLATCARWHPIVRDDGMISVARSFTRAEWEQLLARAGVQADIRWWLGFRWSVSKP